MLVSLVVKDFAIIDRAELTLGSGLTALTGETGAGKSLVVDALTLLGGARGDAGFVRHGAEKAELSAEFSLGDSAVRTWLAELELDDGSDCRIRRVIRADGSSRAFVNDRPVTLQTLKSLAERLFEIHGQHEHQALLSRPRQLALLDGYGAHGAELAQTTALARDWLALQRETALLEARAGGGAQALEFLRFQLDELARHALSPEALDEVEREHRRLSHGGELIEGCTRISEALDGEHDAALRPLCGKLAGELERLSANDVRLEPIAALLREAAVQVDEAVDALGRYLAGEEPDPARLAALDAQLARLHDLSRKHRVPAAELQRREVELRTEYEDIAGADAKLAALRVRQDRVLAAYREAAARLSAARASAAGALGTAVSALMGELGMKGGQFAIELETHADADPAPGGRDAVEFLVSANKGQPPRALRKVASGGELARIGLAIEVAALGNDDVGTMVFDEVDAGIGGAVAEVVGRKLKALGCERQVLCVTHLAQVAAQADQHVAVSKRSDAHATTTAIAVLDANQRLEEIARMLGGVEITSATRAHAASILNEGSLQRR